MVCRLKNHHYNTDSGMKTLRVENQIKDKVMVDQQEKFDEMENLEQSEFLFANMKKTYDQYQTLDTKAINDANKHAAVLDQLSTQALQNAIESANMISKQAIKHADVACDRIWNLDEQGYTAQSVLQDEGVVDTLIAKILSKMAAAE